MKFLEDLKFDNNGLMPAIVQESETGEVLMLAYMNRESLERTIRSGMTHFYSRSRKKLWCKGETSGHVQMVDEVLTDCDCDTILLKVRQQGAACHEGYKSCFYRKLKDASRWKVIASPVFDPERVYGEK